MLGGGLLSFLSSNALRMGAIRLLAVLLDLLLITFVG